MSRRKRRKSAHHVHVDGYAAEAARAQAEREALNRRWEAANKQTSTTALPLLDEVPHRKAKRQ